MTTFDPGARLVFTHGLRVSPFSTAFFATSPAPIITLGFDVFVQLVIAAITTDPCSMAACGGAATAVAARGSALFGHHHSRQRLRESLLRALQRHAILRPLRAREARLDRAEIDVDRLRVDRVGRVLVAIEALRPRVCFDQLDAFGIAAAQAQVIDASSRRSGRRRWSRRTRDTCCRASRGRPASGARDPARRTRRTCRRRRACAAAR